MKISGTKKKLDVELDIEELLHLNVPASGPNKVGDLMINQVRTLVESKTHVVPPPISAIAFTSTSIKVRFMEKIEDAADLPLWPENTMSSLPY